MSQSRANPKRLLDSGPSRTRPFARARASVLRFWRIFPPCARVRWRSWLSRALLAIAVLLVTVDLPFAQWAHDPDGGPFYELLLQLTQTGKSTWYLITTAVLAPLLWYIAGRARRPIDRALLAWWSRYCAFVFAAIAGSGIIVNIFKAALGRARPRMYFREGIYGFDGPALTSGFHSFPSGHTTTLLALGVALALVWRRQSGLILAVAIALASTRAFLNAHYVSDVVAGAALGAFWTMWLAYWCAQRGWVFQLGDDDQLRARLEAVSARRLGRWRAWALPARSSA